MVTATFLIDLANVTKDCGWWIDLLNLSWHQYQMHFIHIECIRSSTCLLPYIIHTRAHTQTINIHKVSVRLSDTPFFRLSLSPSVFLPFCPSFSLVFHLYVPQTVFTLCLYKWQVNFNAFCSNLFPPLNDEREQQREADWKEGNMWCFLDGWSDRAIDSTPVSRFVRMGRASWRTGPIIPVKVLPFNQSRSTTVLIIT